MIKLNNGAMLGVIQQVDPDGVHVKKGESIIKLYFGRGITARHINDLRASIGQARTLSAVLDPEVAPCSAAMLLHPAMRLQPFKIQPQLFLAA